jgi:hypothetical protein
VGAGGVLLGHVVEHPQVHVGNDVDLGEPERDRAAGPAADVAVHVDLVAGEAALRVVATAESRRGFEDAPVAPQRVGEGQQFVLGGVCAGHVAPVGHPVQERARGREPEGPGVEGLVDHRHHGGDVLGGGRVLVE